MPHNDSLWPDKHAHRLAHGVQVHHCRVEILLDQAREAEVGIARARQSRYSSTHGHVKYAARIVIAVLKQGPAFESLT